MAALAFLAAVACGQKSDGDKSGGIQGVVTGPAGTPASEMRVGTVSETASVPVKSGETATRLSVSGAAGAEQLSATSKSPRDGLCLPAVPLAVSVGDTWTISGLVKLSEGFPIELPVPAVEA